MLLALFALGSLGFWSLLGVSTLLMLILVENGRSGWAFLTMAVAAILFFMGGNNDTLHFLMDNPQYIAAGFVTYIFAGIFWTIFKWWVFLSDVKESFLENKVKWLKEWLVVARRTNSGATFTDEDATLAFRDCIKSQSFSSAYGYGEAFKIPDISRNKSRVMHWLAYWPWSVINTLVFDFLRRMWNRVYTLMVDSLRSMVKYKFRDILVDFPVDHDSRR